MTDYLDALAEYLADGGFGVYSPVAPAMPSIFVLRSFDDPIVGDATISLIPRGGLTDDTFAVTRMMENLTVIVRGAVGDTSGPYATSQSVFDYMNPVANETIHGIEFIRLQCQRTPAFLQEDGQRRTEYSIEFQVWLG